MSNSIAWTKEIQIAETSCFFIINGDVLYIFWCSIIVCCIFFHGPLGFCFEELGGFYHSRSTAKAISYLQVVQFNPPFGGKGGSARKYSNWLYVLKVSEKEKCYT